MAWKLIWLATVALPLWLNHQMDPDTGELTNEILWVVVILAVIPWRYAYSTYVLRRAERWRPIRPNQQSLHVSEPASHPSSRG